MIDAPCFNWGIEACSIIKWRRHQDDSGGIVLNGICPGPYARNQARVEIEDGSCTYPTLGFDHVTLNYELY